jgi:CheY-like chemotaxis protein
VDDNRDHLTMLATLLRALDQDVHVASNGPAALWLAASFEPEVIFLDLSMPQMHGYEVAKALRAQPAGKTAKIIALTGMGTETRDSAQAAGFDDLLHKPAAIAEIAAKLEWHRTQ